ncbi:MAG: type VII toxin-antitoxin system MntA family adenylyltransferase antitoxin [Alkalispirochaeta sp.]
MGESMREVVTTVRTEILRCMPETEFVCLFGSFARGEALPFSDIDIAVSTETEPDILTLGDAAGSIEAVCGRPVDILLVRGLSERDPELAFKIASEGVLLYERRRHSYACFKKRAFLSYLDTAYLRSLNTAALHRRVRNRSMGKRNYV